MHRAHSNEPYLRHLLPPQLPQRLAAPVTTRFLSLAATCALALGSYSGCQVGGEVDGPPEDVRADNGYDLGVFDDSFVPQNAPYGGFGGGSCAAANTPIIFVHGNGDEAKNWNFPSATGVPTVYAAFRAAGYTECELFGINWLSEDERSEPQNNYHRSEKAEMLADFVADVIAYTGADEVDIIAHSLGVTVSMHAMEYADMWSSVRRFIAISGGLRGLSACYSVGYANALAPTCGSENLFDSDIFGFYPHGFFVSNSRMSSIGFRDQPQRGTTQFYSIRAGKNDQILCSTVGYLPGCEDSALFDPDVNVRAQLDVGHGSTAADIDFNLEDWTWFNAGGGDIDGVGHFRAKNNTGVIQVEMLTGECTGTTCCGAYAARCE